MVQFTVEMANSTVLPPEVKIYFWGDRLNELNWEKQKAYIVSTLLEKGDLKALRWLFSTIKPTEVKSMLPSLKLTKKSENFWSIYFS